MNKAEIASLLRTLANELEREKEPVYRPYAPRRVKSRRKGLKHKMNSHLENYMKPWGKAEIGTLMQMYNDQVAQPKIAKFLKRSIPAIQSKLTELKKEGRV